LLAIERSGKQELRNDTLPDTLQVRLSRRQIPSGRFGIVAMEGNLRSDAELAAHDQRVLQVLGHDRYLGQRLIPPTKLVKRLAKRNVRLHYPK
jgi:hypothetical protein